MLSTQTLVACTAQPSSLLSTFALRSSRTCFLLRPCRDEAERLPHERFAEPQLLSIIRALRLCSSWRARDSRLRYSQLRIRAKYCRNLFSIGACWRSLLKRYLRLRTTVRHCSLCCITIALAARSIVQMLETVSVARYCCLKAGQSGFQLPVRAPLAMRTSRLESFAIGEGMRLLWNQSRTEVDVG